ADLSNALDLRVCSSPAKAASSVWQRNGARSVSEWCTKSLLDASVALQHGELSAVELTQACIDQIEATRPLNMFVSTDFERAMQLARNSDARRVAGETRGMLDGIPVGVKDLFCMENVPTTAASKILEGFVSPYESTATARLLQQGAIPLGKLNMDEFAMGSGTLYSKFGATVNPWSLDLEERAVVAGGSSGGSAAAVASGCCFAALGSDTGGSCSDTVEASLQSQKVDLTGVRVGVPAEYFVDELPEEILSVWDKGIAWLRDAGMACAGHIRACAFDYYERGVILRQRIRQDFQRAFHEQGIDVLLTPTTPSGPFLLHNKETTEDPVGMYLNDVMTVPANMAGVPAISLPAALTSEGDYPLGLQLMGARKTENRVLQVANALEQRASFADLIPARVYETER
ncbi:hypothetical protein BBJ28_00025424, partial [Nothophytophthora sp. Chile5]